MSDGVTEMVSALSISMPGPSRGHCSGSSSPRKPAKPAKQVDPNKILYSTFPWLQNFHTLCREAVGSKNVKVLEGLLSAFNNHVTMSIQDCYCKKNRAGRLRKVVTETLTYFHLFYQDIKFDLEVPSCYLDKMMELVAMYIDLEIKSSARGVDSLKKIGQTMTSSLYTYLDHSEDHMVDALLRTKLITKSHWELCEPVVAKFLKEAACFIAHEHTYVRYLLAFKLWKKLAKKPLQRRNIVRMACQKLDPPVELIPAIKNMRQVLPSMPLINAKLTLFLMTNNFNFIEAKRVFLRLYGMGVVTNSSVPRSVPRRPVQRFDFEAALSQTLQEPVDGTGDTFNLEMNLTSLVAPAEEPVTCGVEARLPRATEDDLEIILLPPAPKQPAMVITLDESDEETETQAHPRGSKEQFRDVKLEPRCIPERRAADSTQPEANKQAHRAHSKWDSMHREDCPRRRSTEKMSSMPTVMTVATGMSTQPEPEPAPASPKPESLQSSQQPPEAKYTTIATQTEKPAAAAEASDTSALESPAPLAAKPRTDSHHDTGVATQTARTGVGKSTFSTQTERTAKTVNSASQKASVNGKESLATQTTQTERTAKPILKSAGVTASQEISVNGKESLATQTTQTERTAKTVNSASQKISVNGKESLATQTERTAKPVLKSADVTATRKSQEKTIVNGEESLATQTTQTKHIPKTVNSAAVAASPKISVSSMESLATQTTQTERTAKPVLKSTGVTASQKVIVNATETLATQTSPTEHSTKTVLKSASVTATQTNHENISVNVMESLATQTEDTAKTVNSAVLPASLEKINVNDAETLATQTDGIPTPALLPEKSVEVAKETLAAQTEDLVAKKPTLRKLTEPALNFVSGNSIEQNISGLKNVEFENVARSYRIVKAPNLKDETRVAVVGKSSVVRLHVPGPPDSAPPVLQDMTLQYRVPEVGQEELVVDQAPSLEATYPDTSDLVVDSPPELRDAYESRAPIFFKPKPQSNDAEPQKDKVFFMPKAKWKKPKETKKEVVVMKKSALPDHDHLTCNSPHLLFRPRPTAPVPAPAPAPKPVTYHAPPPPAPIVTAPSTSDAVFYINEPIRQNFIPEQTVQTSQTSPHQHAFYPKQQVVVPRSPHEATAYHTAQEAQNVQSYQVSDGPNTFLDEGRYEASEPNNFERQERYEYEQERYQQARRPSADLVPQERFEEHRRTAAAERQEPAVRYEEHRRPSVERQESVVRYEQSRRPSGDVARCGLPDNYEQAKRAEYEDPRRAEMRIEQERYERYDLEQRNRQVEMERFERAQRSQPETSAKPAAFNQPYLSMPEREVTDGAQALLSLRADPYDPFASSEMATPAALDMSTNRDCFMGQHSTEPREPEEEDMHGFSRDYWEPGEDEDFYRIGQPVPNNFFSDDDPILQMLKGVLPDPSINNVKKPVPYKPSDESDDNQEAGSLASLFSSYLKHNNTPQDGSRAKDFDDLIHGDFMTSFDLPAMDWRNEESFASIYGRPRAAKPVEDPTRASASRVNFSRGYAPVTGLQDIVAEQHAVPKGSVYPPYVYPQYGMAMPPPPQVPGRPCIIPVDSVTLSHLYQSRTELELRKKLNKIQELKSQDDELLRKIEESFLPSRRQPQGQEEEDEEQEGGEGGEGDVSLPLKKRRKKMTEPGSEVAASTSGSAAAVSKAPTAAPVSVATTHTSPSKGPTAAPGAAPSSAFPSHHTRGRGRPPKRGGKAGAKPGPKTPKGTKRTLDESPSVRGRPKKQKTWDIVHHHTRSQSQRGYAIEYNIAATNGS